MGIEHQTAYRSLPGVPTGFSRLDMITSGLQPEHLVVLAGLPGIGMTTFALNVALNASSQGIPVLFLTLDQTRHELMERLLAIESGINSNDLRRGYLDYQTWKNKLHPASESLVKRPLLIHDPVALTIEQLQAQASQLDEWTTCGSDRHRALIVVDSLHSVEPAFRGETAEREVAEVARGLKRLARRTGIPVLAVSSLNRGPTRQERLPLLSDLRGSGSIEGAADLVMFLVERVADEREHEIIIAKNRGGLTGAVALRVQAECGRFAEFSLDD
ncbi:MAG TPA: DnaB-like helicase C-terminal domain-containing protein [Polyangia bacterium]|nr:DnaB-like helicase C-terminal domain-containing protein [Polyangia bacterium]